MFQVLRKMRDWRVSVVSIEAAEGNYTVALCFLNDLLYLLRLPDYYYFFNQPVMVFLKELNSNDDLSQRDDTSDD